ncbi:hypothetical protein ACFE04_002628 [Oxalis oulophora]
MAFQSFFIGRDKLQSKSLDINDDVLLNMNWDHVVCPICLDYPHNVVLLHCSSYEKGCRPFVCDTDHLHSNCLDRFKTAYGMKNPSSPQSDESQDNNDLLCPLCRGKVTGWVVIEKARLQLDKKKRCCEENKCSFKGTYLELQKHAQMEHPHSHPAKIDSARQLDWENFQQSSEMIDVLSTIHSEIPRGVVLGDYVIEYGDNEETDHRIDEFPTDEANWWTCSLYQAFNNLRSSRNRRRSSRRGSHRTSSNSDEDSVVSVDFADYRIEQIEDDFMNAWDNSGHNSGVDGRRLVDVLGNHWGVQSSIGIVL